VGCIRQMSTNSWLVPVACTALISGCSLAPSQPPVSSTTPSASQMASSTLADLTSRPMKVPHLAPGATCPQSKMSRASPYSGDGLGTGPAYAITGGQDLVADPNVVTKVLWVVDPKYGGPVRIRGAQLDGVHGLLFEAGGNHWSGAPVKTLERSSGAVNLEAGTPTGAPWRYWPSYTYAESPGCYAWQVDGLSFTELIVVAVHQPAYA
jgi:hypothetical protein